METCLKELDPENPLLIPNGDSRSNRCPLTHRESPPLHWIGAPRAHPAPRAGQNFVRCLNAILCARFEPHYFVTSRHRAAEKRRSAFEKESCSTMLPEDQRSGSPLQVSRYPEP